MNSLIKKFKNEFHLDLTASLGDLVTLLLLSEISSLLYNDKEDGWLAPLLIVVYVLFVPICIYVATRNKDVTTGKKIEVDLF